MSTPAAVRAWEGHVALYRRIWRSNLMGAFVQPLLYLLAMGIGVGALVDRGGRADRLLDGLTYFEFLAPALLATTAMMVCTNEALWPVMAGFRWMRGFHAQAASPLSPGEVAAGVALWHATKAAISVTGVAAVLLLFDGTRSVGLVAAIPFGVLTGVAFAAPITAWAASRETEGSFPTILRFVVMPMFLFAGAFFPIDQLPGWLQPVAKATPLWHGVELCRGAVHATLRWAPAAAHVGYLLVFAAIGWTCSHVAFVRRLST